MFKPGDLVTFTDNLTLFDANTCLFTFKGELVKNPYGKPGRQWVVMVVIPPRVYANADALYLLCPIAEGPEEHDGEPSLELPEGTFGLIDHDTYFQRGVATVAPEASMRPWFIATKAKSRQSVHSLAGQPEWPAMEKAFWKLWGKAVEYPVKSWNKLLEDRTKLKPPKKK